MLENIQFNVSILKSFEWICLFAIFFCCFLWITKQVSSFSNGKHYCKQSTRIELSEVTVRTMEIAQQKNRYFYEPPKCLRNDWRSIKNGGRLSPHSTIEREKKTRNLRILVSTGENKINTGRR